MYLNEEGHSAGVDNGLGLVWRAGGYVGEGPGSLELQGGGVTVAQELYQPEGVRGS